MLEINCNKCENLIDQDAGCKLYGSNPDEAVNACANDRFRNYKPKNEGAPALDAVPAGEDDFCAACMITYTNQSGEKEAEA